MRRFADFRVLPHGLSHFRALNVGPSCYIASQEGQMTVNRERELKLLGLRSGGVCAFMFDGKPCRKPLTATNPDDCSIVLLGHGAHIVAQADSGPRGDRTMTPADRDRAGNQLWLCTQ